MHLMLGAYVIVGLVSVHPPSAVISPAAGGAAPARPDTAIFLPADEARLVATIRSLPAQRSPGPTEEHIAGLKRTEEVLIERVRDLGYQPATTTVHWRRRGEPGRDWRNIAFEVGGRTLPREVVLVGAHFDAVAGSPGADDNGAAVGALLEMARLARVRSDAHGAPTRTLRFVLFNLEEVGLVGATQYAAEAAEREAGGGREEPGGERIIAMLSLDCIGYFSDEAGSQRNPFAALKGLSVPETGDFLAVATTLANRPMVRTLERHMRAAVPGAKFFVFDVLPIAPPDLLRSDHAPFLLRGVPAAIVSDTANFRNPHYHQPSDTIETLDLKRLTLATGALAAGVWGLAEGGIDGAVDSGPARTNPGPAAKEKP